MLTWWIITTLIYFRHARTHARTRYSYAYICLVWFDSFYVRIGAMTRSINNIINSHVQFTTVDAHLQAAKLPINYRNYWISEKAAIYRLQTCQTVNYMHDISSASEYGALYLRIYFLATLVSISFLSMVSCADSAMWFQSRCFDEHCRIWVRGIHMQPPQCQSE